MRDFTLKKYRELLQTFKQNGYLFMTYADYCEQKNLGLPDRFVIFRHDVDAKAENALQIAKIEVAEDVRATYYFRVVSQSNKADIIRNIAVLGHEIGYHYEDMDICNGNIVKAAEHFVKHLEFFRQYYPIKTVCMHGSLRSRFDNKDLWRAIDYHDFGIIGEPYLDTEFDHIFYLTDTGRRWDGYRVSLRDKVPQQTIWHKEGLSFHHTDDVIHALKENRFSAFKGLLVTTHPQRWTDQPTAWLKESLLQTIKNGIKYCKINHL